MRRMKRTDDFGESAVVTLDVSGHALRFYERRAEEDERVGWTWDMARIAFLCVGGLDSGGRDGVGGGGGNARRVFFGYKFEARCRLGDCVGGAEGRVWAVWDGCKICVE